MFDRNREEPWGPFVIPKTPGQLRTMSRYMAVMAVLAFLGGAVFWLAVIREPAGALAVVAVTAWFAAWSLILMRIAKGLE